MKKAIVLIAVTVLAGLFAGCSSVPQHCNMTGTWSYTFEETGRDGKQTGSMKVTQEGYKLSGKCNDAFGEFDLTGNTDEIGPKFVMDGKRNDGKRNFHLIASLKNDNEFDGTYTTDQNTSGTLKATRSIAK
jgi:hypothetical protein